MIFLALLAALLLEYFRPLAAYFRACPWFSRYARFLEHLFNAGERRHGALAWLLAVVPPVVLSALVYVYLNQFASLLGALWGGAILYLLMGFRASGVNAANIAASLRRQDLEEAQRLLGQWLGRDASSLSATEVARLSIENVLGDAYRHLFGVMIWFAAFGPGGAVLYRFSRMLDEKWGELDEEESGDFGKFAAGVFVWLDWIPQRLTAISFAVVGDFEDAMYCWRLQAQQWTQRGLGIILASGAGAMGVKLGDPVPRHGEIEFRPELGLGDEADADYLDSAIGMVWRALVLWLVLLLLLNLARWSGA